MVDEIRAAGGSAVANHDSVATAEGAAALVKAAVSAFGHVDVLVNNAGILRDKSFLKMDEAMWDAVVAVHLKGTFLCSQVFAKQIVAQGSGGRIVNTTSVSGMLGNFGQANYSSAKAGIYGLTRTMSIELQKHRITVNAIAPIAKTRMTEDLPMFQGVDTPHRRSTSRRPRSFWAATCAAIARGTCSRSPARASTPSRSSRRPGRFKEADNGVWTAQEIAESWDAIVKV